MKRRLSLFFLCLGLQAQNFTFINPDCIIIFTFTAAGQTSPTSPNAGFDNRSTGCTTWVVNYTNSGFSALSVALQSAANSGGTPGSYSNGFPVQQTVLAGNNPMTNLTAGFVQVIGYNAWVRVTLASKTGTGVINGAAYGYRIPSAGLTPAGTTNVAITSPIGQQAMATSVSVAVASDQSDVPTNIDKYGGAAVTLGQKVMASSMPVAIASNQSAIPTTSAPSVACPNQALFNLSGSGNTQIVAASGSTKIYICHISFATGAPEDVKLTTGTGSNCASGTADLTGLYKSVSAIALDQELAPIITAASQALCISQSAVQALGGIVIYGQQ